MQLGDIGRGEAVADYREAMRIELLHRYGPDASADALGAGETQALRVPKPRRELRPAMAHDGQAQVDRPAEGEPALAGSAWLPLPQWGRGFLRGRSGNHALVITPRRSRLLQRLAQVGDYVVFVLDANREADIAIGYAGLKLLLRGELRVRRAGRMDREATRVADISYVVEHPQRVDEAASGIKPALQLEPEQPAIAALQIGVGAAPLFPFHQARIDHAADLRVAAQEFGDRGGIGAMRPHP